MAIGAVASEFGWRARTPLMVSGRFSLPDRSGVLAVARIFRERAVQGRRSIVIGLREGCEKGGDAIRQIAHERIGLFVIGFAFACAVRLQTIQSRADFIATRHRRSSELRRLVATRSDPRGLQIIQKRLDVLVAVYRGVLDPFGKLFP